MTFNCRLFSIEEKNKKPSLSATEENETKVIVEINKLFLAGSAWTAATTPRRRCRRRGRA
jgi:hypothetical protein